MVLCSWAFSRNFEIFFDSFQSPASSRSLMNLVQLTVQYKCCGRLFPTWHRIFSSPYIYIPFHYWVIHACGSLTRRCLFRINGVIDSGGSKEAVNELLWNLVGAAVIIVYYVITSIVLFVIIDKMGSFKVGSADQKSGLDMIKHKESAYIFGEDLGENFTLLVCHIVGKFGRWILCFLSENCRFQSRLVECRGGNNFDFLFHVQNKILPLWHSRRRGFGQHWTSGRRTVLRPRSTRRRPLTRGASYMSMERGCHRQCTHRLRVNNKFANAQCNCWKNTVQTFSMKTSW